MWSYVCPFSYCSHILLYSFSMSSAYIFVLNNWEVVRDFHTLALMARRLQYIHICLIPFLNDCFTPSIHKMTKTTRNWITMITLCLLPHLYYILLKEPQIWNILNMALIIIVMDHHVMHLIPRVLHIDRQLIFSGMWPKAELTFAVWQSLIFRISWFLKICFHKQSCSHKTPET